MRRVSKIDGVLRIIDANINRTKEGLRVCEEVVRFILSNRNLTFALKKIRHNLNTLFKNLPQPLKLIKERHSLTDPGKNIFINELKRKNYADIFFANMQRVKESIRVLEEFSKLINKNTAVGLKNTRYKIYVLEKRVAEKISTLHHHR